MKKRVHYLTKKEMQLGLTFRFLFLTILFAVFIGFEVIITVWPVVSEIIPDDLMVLVRNQILFRLIFFSLPLIFVITALVFIFTHRIAGPLFRLEQTLDRLIRGEEVKKIHLRKNDELKELAAKINDLISIIQK